MATDLPADRPAPNPTPRPSRVDESRSDRVKPLTKGVCIVLDLLALWFIAAASAARNAEMTSAAVLGGLTFNLLLAYLISIWFRRFSRTARWIAFTVVLCILAVALMGSAAVEASP